jgi:hypothetical protein
MDSIIVIFTMEVKTTIRDLDLHQENGQKGTATIIKREKLLREWRRLEQLQKVINARLGFPKCFGGASYSRAGKSVSRRSKAI